MMFKSISCAVVLALMAGTIAFSQTPLSLGADLSMLPRYESVRTPYYKQNGVKISNVLAYLRDEAQLNAVRVRLFVQPRTGEALDGVVQDLEYVKTFGQRIKQAGMDFMLDIHYSDTWADPANQTVPASWYTGTLSRTNPTNATLVDSVYSYTKRTIAHLAANGATPDFVQIGNEVSYGMLWRTAADKCYASSTPSVWNHFTNLLSAAASAVREAAPKARIVLHIERSGDSNATRQFFQKMQDAQVDYDIIGLSYYPFWHGYLPALSATLSALEKNFPDKPVHIVETAYYYQYFPTTSDIKFQTTDTWPATAQGQQTYIEDLCACLAKHRNVTGLYYWFAEENGNGGASATAANKVLNTRQNRGLWNNSTHRMNPGLLKLQNFIRAKRLDEVKDLIQLYIDKE